MKEKSLEEVREWFLGDHFATLNGAVIDEIDDHSSVCSLDIEEGHRNALGAVMGGAIFMLADFAFAVAANWQEIGTVSLNSGITYLGGAKGKRLIANAVCIKDGKNTSCYQIRVQDELGNDIAVVTTTGFKKI